MLSRKQHSYQILDAEEATMRVDEMFEYTHKRIDHQRAAILVLTMIVFALTIYVMWRG